MTARSVLETEIQRRIQVELGSEPDLLLLRNSVGEAKHIDEDTGKVWTVPYGLGTGSPDLVGLLRIETINGEELASWFCLEVKCPGEKPNDAQKKSHEVWRRFGAFIAVVTSPIEAREALRRARLGALS